MSCGKYPSKEELIKLAGIPTEPLPTATGIMLQEQEAHRLQELAGPLTELYEAVRLVMLKGYGEVTAIIRDGKVTRIVKTEEKKLD